MANSPHIKPTHKAVKDYYNALESYARQNVEHEGAVRSAFQNLLDQTGRRLGWTLIPELGVPGTKRRTVYPDGTFRDDYSFLRGYWEAKDSHDNLETEIKKKIATGYPLTNIIFEDTRQAYLYQNSRQAMRADLTDKQQLCDLLNAFFSFTEPAHEDFNRAIEDFKERVPDLARGLVEKIQDAHQNNPDFIEAFDKFYELCQSSLNPNVSIAAVDEMLVQHLLTERLMRTIFDRQDFTRRNVIAAEVEKVIDALAGRAFSRHEFLKSLDRFYVAIESAARSIEDFSDKQHFLNTVYEQFFQGYSVKVADTHGIVYTPQEIVDFMCASVAEVLQTEFGKSLGDPDVNVLDPCTGTGNFIVNLLRRIPKRDLPRMYREQLFANEVMLLPYYIAALNIEHAYYELTGEYEPFDGLCFVDTLDLAEERQKRMFTEANTERVERQKNAPITVIIGNPPYNANQVNENDNNKNRKYDITDKRIKETYVKATSATKTKCYDPYVRFFRWATDRLGDREGIVCLVTNNSFVHQTACDGLRRLLSKEFSTVYHLDLRGNVRQNPKLSGSAYNVFGIQLGVGITVAIRKHRNTMRTVGYHAVPLDWRREKKLRWLDSTESCNRVEWFCQQDVSIDSWPPGEEQTEFDQLTPLGTKKAKSASDKTGFGVIFGTYSLGVSTNRDAVTYDFQTRQLIEKVNDFCEAYNAEVDRYRRNENKIEDLDAFLDTARVKWSRNLKRHLKSYDELDFAEQRIRKSLYRPFTVKRLYFADFAVDELGQMPNYLPDEWAEKENAIIVVSTVGCERGFFTSITSILPNLNFVGFGGGGQCFPFYVYDKDGGNRRENITDWALSQFRSAYGDSSISKWDIFYYVYGLLHHPGYREKFADNLKRELPRVPFAPSPQPSPTRGEEVSGFRAFAKAGQQLAELHLNYEQLEPYPLQWLETPDMPLSYRVEKMRLSKDKTSLKVNDSLTLAGIPPETFDYRLGNRSALEWVIDQYRVKTDKRSGITSDPNRDDDPEYIVRLTGQVVQVSIETVKIVESLPDDFGGLAGPE